MIVVSAEELAKHEGHGGWLPTLFNRQDDGDVYSAICSNADEKHVSGSISVTNRPMNVQALVNSRQHDKVLVVAWREDGKGRMPLARGGNTHDWTAKGYVRTEKKWEERLVVVAPIQEDLFSRTKGIFETDIVADQCVSVFGLGSGGGPITIGLAKFGVNLIVVDHDRIELANVVRHPAGLSDIGRYKTKFMAAKIRDKNPYANVEAHEVKIGPNTTGLVRKLVHKSDLVICAVDDPIAKVVLNRVCVEEGKTLIIAGAFRRAYGGQVLVVRPNAGPCYQCFRQSLPEDNPLRPIAASDEGPPVAYSDRPVPIEPGLSNDIAAISQMVVKLVLCLLLRGKETTLRSLEEDLVAPLFLWLNRREPGTDYERLAPLGFDINGLHILRWYGVDLERREDCVVCGDFVSRLTEVEGLKLRPEDAYVFGPEGCQQ